MRVILANPRGFCAGVVRAIECVEEALKQYGPPVYVLNDIVHNAAVVGDLREKGAVFVKDLAEVPEGAHLLFSAHGVAPFHWESAKLRNAEIIDATCPLVDKVHREARRFATKGYTILLIGEPGHDEVVGTMGQAPDHIRLVTTPEDAREIDVPNTEKLAYLTQTTLSVDDCMRVINVLKDRFPDIQGPPSSDICYATQNRQTAVRALVEEADLVLVVGDRASANSTRLKEIAETYGKPSYLIPTADAIDDDWIDVADTILLTSGASAPDSLVAGVIRKLQSMGPVEVDEREVISEDVSFSLPVIN
jgi:4-hydroxy-3-methylbut-2-enyl diphosphate reductase